jgi:hypothetical protein
MYNLTNSYRNIPTQNDEAREQFRAANRFNTARLRGEWNQFKARLTGQPRHLKDLNEEHQGRCVRRAYAAGTQSVAIRDIVGSESRSQDFDRDFNPVNLNLRDRWRNIAALVAQNVPLPPVELIQVGEAYYVRDGHHRISVAKNAGQSYVDAEVTVLELTERQKVNTAGKFTGASVQLAFACG